MNTPSKCGQSMMLVQVSHQDPHLISRLESNQINQRLTSLVSEISKSEHLKTFLSISIILVSPSLQQHSGVMTLKFKRIQESIFKLQKNSFPLLSRNLQRWMLDNIGWRSPTHQDMTQQPSMWLFLTGLAHQGKYMLLTLLVNHSILTGLLLLILVDLLSPTTLLRNVKLVKNLLRLAATSQHAIQESEILLLEKNTILRFMLKTSMVFLIQLWLMSQLLPNIHLILQELQDSQETWPHHLIL